MNFNIKKVHKMEGLPNVIVLADKPANLPAGLLTPTEIAYITNQFEVHEKNQFEFNKFDHWQFIHLLDLEEHTPFKRAESLRKAGDKLAQSLNEQKCESVTIIDCLTENNATFYLIEGIALGNYQFLKYQTKAADKRNTLKEVIIISQIIKQASIDELNCVIEAVWMARDLINEPNSTLTATHLSDALSD